MCEILTRYHRGIHLLCCVLVNCIVTILLLAPTLTHDSKVPDIRVVHVEQPTDLQCLVSAVYHEARGEPDRGKRAVLDVIRHRAKKTGTRPCEVVGKDRQFPWFVKKGLVPVNTETLSYYNAAVRHKKVLTDEKYIFFNRGPVFGTGCVKIGHHKFCKEIS